MNRPKGLLIYYGWLSSFNSASNGWNNEKVAQEIAKYGLVVLGDGVQDSGHGDYANTEVIIPRIKELNPNCLIFGYVTVNQTLANFVTKAGEWNDFEVDGIFMDEAGYDYGKKRDEFNDRVDYIHSLSCANLCFANAWNFDHILGTENDASYANTTYNENEIESNLNESDFCLLESFPINTTAYSNENGYESKSDWTTRGDKAISLREAYGCHMIGSGIIADGDENEDDLFAFGFVSAVMYSLDGFGTSDTSYGSGSAKTKYVTRPDISNMGELFELAPSINVDSGDGDVYMRYVEFGKLSLDFSSGDEDSTIAKY